ncbi:MAG: acyl--CoA ligase [Verrucomicrobiota bacterium]|nr:acyl--CoA ligase [Verrucomicrobiota bacterium]
MKTNDALLSAWNATRSACGAKPAIFNTRRKVLRTFAEIETEALALSDELFGSFAPGDVVAIQIGNHPSWPALLLAALRRRVVVLPLERTISEREREVACQVCHAAAVIEDENEERVRLTRHSSDAIDWGERQPVLLKLTSGTTAAPRAIRFRSGQLVADCEQICDTMRITASDLNFGVIPVSHSYGFSNLIMPLLVRGVPLVLSRDRMPRAVLDDLARTGATVFAGMPVFYQAFCEIESPPRLPQLRLCISAGAPLQLSVAQRFRDKFGQPIHSFYGSSECGGICYDTDAPLVEAGFVGRAMRGVDLELLEPDAAMSRIRVRSAAAGDGYFPEPDEARLGSGVFVPDDLLARSGDGFRIAGRASDVINVAGKKVNPAEVEAALLAFDGVREAVVFGRASTLRNEEVAACIVADEHVQQSELLDFCRRQLSGWQVPKRIFFLEAMPMTERGKISRRRLAEQFAS